MLLRIVKMSFLPDKTDQFLLQFEQVRPKIAGFEGCLHLALYQDAQAPNVYYTLSQWRSAEDLERYRNSELFKHTWAQTKPLFQARPEAFSMVEPARPATPPEQGGMA
jgi:quinol monooxygenase YgiN